MKGRKAAFALARIETILFLREPFAVFFSLAFPLILLLFVGSIGGSEQVPGGARFIDSYMAVMVGVTAANVGLMGMAIHIAENRGLGVLKRYRLSPMPAWAYFFAQFVTALVTLAISVAALATLTLTIYGPPTNVNWGLFLLLSVFSMYVTMSYGLLLGGLPLPVRSVQVVSAGLFFLLFFASGAALPREAFPPWLQWVSAFNPLSVINDALMNSYIGLAIAWPALGVLAVTTMIVNIITARVFDWEGNQ